jgi:paraquat-inducible protein B
MTTPADDDEFAALPTAILHRPHRSRLPLVWVVPIIAAIIGAWLAIHAFLDHGPTITVTFLDAEGIEAGKTKVRYQNVDIGDVKTIALAPDRHTVSVTIETARFATPFLVAGTRFWIVRPRLGASGVSGLGTLLSGAYIAMDVGNSNEEARNFVGLERQPVVAGDAKGRQFVLSSQDLGSLAASSPVYFHHIEVGQISSVALNPDGRGVTLTVFIAAPYDRFVTQATRFWHASGVDVEVNSSGLHVQSQSLTSILAGGIAFESLDEAAGAPPAFDDAHFTLAADRSTALKTPDGSSEPYVLYFDESLRGLAPGAAVDFRGVEIGEVTALNVSYDQAGDKFRFPVSINVYPDRLRARYADDGEQPQVHSHELVARMIEHGFRAQLRSSSLLTGQLYIALDFFPGAAKVIPAPDKTPMPVPTIPGNLEQIQASIISVARKLDRLPLDKIAHDLDTTIMALNATLGGARDDLLPEAKSTLTQARQTLLQTQQTLAPESTLQGDLHATLSSVSKAADSVRVLADYLDKHPEALIRGKPKETE